MDLVDIRRPGDAIARVNPYFVWKKSQGLMSQGLVLGSHSRVPLGPRYLRKDQESKHQHPAEASRKPNRVESSHFFPYQSLFLQPIPTYVDLIQRERVRGAKTSAQVTSPILASL